MKAVVCCHKKRMKNKVWRVLVPLFFHMSDQTQSVAKVQISKLASDMGKGVMTSRGWPRRHGPGLLAAGMDISQTCPTWSSRSRQQQPVATEA